MKGEKHAQAKQTGKPDYNAQMKENIGAVLRQPVRPHILLHCCCGPCTAGVAGRLQGFAVTPFFYNPNLDTQAEYDRRAAALHTLLSAAEVGDVSWSPEIVSPYDSAPFYACVQGLESLPEGGERCRACIRMRLAATAQTAAERGIEWFCSTLSISPHKDAEFINEAGTELGARYGVRWLPSDFKKENGFALSVRRSRELGLYRQDYCGCAFSRRGGKSEQ